jgi:hypothetical protein
MANPSPDYPTSIHSQTDTSNNDDQFLGATNPKHTDVHGKVEEEITAIQTKLGIGSSAASSAAANTVLAKGATNTTWTAFTTLLGTATTNNLPQGSTNLYSQWQADSPGIIYTGHIAVGANADVDGNGQINSLLQDLFGAGTYSSVSNIQETRTGTPNVYTNGLNVKLASNYSSSPTTVIAIEALAATLAGNTAGSIILAGFFGGSAHRGTGTVGSAFGLPGIAALQSAGTITSAYGLYGNVQNTGSGTITTGYGCIIVSNTNTGGGTFTTNYGLYLENQTAGVTDYNLYSAGLSSRNFFDGYVETSSSGGFYLGTVGSVNNRFLLNAPLTTDATVEQMNTPSSTARKALVLQMRSSQTANAFEVQDNTGAILTSITPVGLVRAPDGTAAAPSLAFDDDTDNGLYRPTTNQVGLATGGTAQAIFDGALSAGSLLELAPTDRTYTATHAFIKNDNTYTANFSNASYPVAWDYGSTIIFQQDGFGFGSGFLFYNHPTIQNNSGSTRSVGPVGGFVSQPIIQANGGTLTTSLVVGFLGNSTINRINSGTNNVTTNVGFYSQGTTVGAGSTLTDDYGVAIEQAGTNSGTWTNAIGVQVASYTLGTNRYSAKFAAPSTSGATTVRTLWLSYNADNTVESAGIHFGLSADTNLFRMGANILGTNDQLRSARAASTDLAFSALITTDGVRRFSVDAAGLHEWGPGGAGAIDTNLYRSAANTLKTDDSFVCADIDTGNGAVELAAGTYTPTRSAETNLDANVTMTEAQYMRVGNTVTVSGRFTADPTLTATTTSFEITLPVSSNLGAADDVAGTAFCGSIAGQGAMVFGVAANDTAKVQWVAGDVTSQTWSYQFTYQVI